MSRIMSAMHLVTYPVSVAVPQVLGLIVLSAVEFGQFSLMYLSYAFAVSLLLSVVSEPYARADQFLRDKVASVYQSVAGAISLLAASVTLACGVLVGVGWVNVVLAMAAVYCASSWTSSRYQLVHLGVATKVFMVELAGISSVITVVGLVAIVDELTLSTVLLCWLLHNAVCILGTRSLAVPSFSRLIWWVRQLKHHVRPLLAESLIQDLGAIGVPFILAPFLGSASFGRYRAISNIAFPVRLGMSAARPMLARKSIGRLLSPKWILAAVGAFSILGLTAGAVLEWLPHLVSFGGVVLELDRYAVACGLFVFSNGLNFYFYFVSRVHASGAELFRHRLAQTVLVIAGPLGGLAADGESGAVWGFVTAALLSVPIWYSCARRSQPRKA